MPTVGNLVVNLSANSAGFNKGIAAAQQKLESFVKVAGAAAVAAGAFAVRTFASMGDELDKMSIRTGVSVESLSELGFAAKRGGTDLNAVEQGLRRLSATVRDAHLGLSTATDAFDDLGLTVEQLEGLSVQDQFALVARALDGVEHSGQRAAIAMKVFGRSGTSLIPMLSNLDDTTREAHRLGQVMTTLEAKQAAALTDSFGDLAGAVSYLFFRIGGELAPIITRLSNLLAGLANINATTRKTLILVGTALAGVATSYLAMAATAKAAAAAQAFVLALSGPKGWILVAAGIAAATGAIHAMNRALDDTGAALRQINDIAEESPLPALNNRRQQGVGSREFFRLPMHIRMVSDAVAFFVGVSEEELAVSRKSLAQQKEQERVSTALAAIEMERARQAEQATARQERWKTAVEESNAALRGLMTPAARMQAELDEFTATLTRAADAGLNFNIQAQKIRFIEQKSGFADMFRSVADEIRILNGEITETGILLENMANVGVDPERIEALRKLFAERDQLAKTAQKPQKDDIFTRKPAAKDLGATDRFTGAFERGSAEALRLVLGRGPGKSAEVKAIEQLPKGIGVEFKKAVTELKNEKPPVAGPA